jgi:hypothetical protein
VLLCIAGGFAIPRMVALVRHVGAGGGPRFSFFYLTRSRV